MIIKYTDGKKVNTKNMNDCEAMVSEKVEDFHQFCMKYKIPYFLTCVYKDGQNIILDGGFNANNNTKNYRNILYALSKFFKENGDEFEIRKKDLD